MCYAARWPCLPALLLIAVSACGQAGEDDTRPSILLIVADDLGYADLGVFGSDIRTPNIDALASEGVLFTQFHTAPMCAPTRAMLLTGNNNHVAGMGRQGAEGLVQLYLPGYETHLSDRVAPMPRLLRDAGYHTYTAGKWHMGEAVEESPQAAGFERSFNLAHGAGSHFSSVGFFEGGSIYRADGDEVEYPDGEYTTELFTDRLIEFIDSRSGDGRPFFAFAAYTSPHWPMQVPDDYLDLYAGQYDTGYDVLRELRFESLKRAGIIPQTSSLPPRNEAITPWNDLGTEQQRREARKMELYASMVENLDFHVGRLIDHLKSNGLYDNTLIVFISDNGAAAEDFYNVGQYVPYVRDNYDNSYENMGKAPYPTDGSVMPMLGESVIGLLSGDATVVHDDAYITTLFHRGRGFLRQGKWKLVNLEPPFDESRFELFDLEADPGESTNLAAIEPERWAAMIELWRVKRQELGIVLPEDL